MNRDEENIPFNLATEVVSFTNCNVFLTGKAGTGKTTFLKYIKEHSPKSTVVVAPTGVAAINAGGVTMHSFFQLPFIPYLPHETRMFGNTATVDRSALIKSMRMSREKIDLLNDLELLIIDEVSMLRADMLDAMDDILRHFRRKHSIPFGGVQVLFIGDLFQLPPVASDAEWNLMKDHYASPFFFSAKVIEKNPPLYIELKKIYRQKEEQFIELLNHIRNNQMNPDDFRLLNERLHNGESDLSNNVITLTTHNYMADKINQQELRKLEGVIHHFNGEVKGDFSEKNYPTEMQLSLKVGAQIMFVKNDSDPAKRYFNGKLATVKALTDDKITVTFTDTNTEMELEKEKWSNIRYVMNKDTNHIEEEELGSFSQYPIRLAWAITIHKSQGLTFDKVVIDAGASFAAGQVYVALSRCRTLDGIVLLSRIYEKSLHSDDRIIHFSAKENSLPQIQEMLEQEKPLFAAQLLLKTFDWTKLVNELHHFDELTEKKKLPSKDMLKGISVGLIEQVNKQKEFADRFTIQLEQIIRERPVNEELLNERMIKAKNYFVQALNDEVLTPLKKIKEFLKGKSQVRQYLNELNELEEVVWKKLNAVQRISFGEFHFEIPLIEREVTEPKKPKTKAAKVPKGNSKAESLAFYKQGMSAAEIAAQRGFTVGTIESHLAEYVSTGEVNVFDFVSEAQLTIIQKAIKEAEGTITSVKQLVGEEISYSQIRIVISYLRREEGSRMADHGSL